MKDVVQKLREIKAKTSAIATQSLKRYAKQRGVSIETVEAEIRTSRKYNLMSNAASFESVNLSGGMKEYYQMIEGKTFWEILDFEHSYYFEKYVQAILPMAGSKLINRKYVDGLAAQLGVFAVNYPGDKEFLKDFISLIPHIHLYEYEFNAFLEGRSVIENIPAVFLYQTLFGIFQNLTGIFVRNLFKPVQSEGKNQVRNASYTEMVDTSNDPIFRFGLITNLDSLLGRDAEAAVNLNPMSQVESVVHACTLLVSNFIVLHEYGHLMRGHLESTATRIELEHEADFFAYTGICKYATDNKIPFYTVMMTLSIVFITLHILDLQFKQPVTTHPPAIERFKYMIRSTPDYEMAVNALILWNNITLLINPSLQKHYDLTITYFDIPKK